MAACLPNQLDGNRGHTELGIFFGKVKCVNKDVIQLLIRRFFFLAKDNSRLYKRQWTAMVDNWWRLTRYNAHLGLQYACKGYVHFLTPF